MSEDLLELYLVRHAPSRNRTNGKKIIQGTLDTPLLPGYEEDVTLVAEELSEHGPFAATLASTSQRAYKTVEV